MIPTQEALRPFFYRGLCSGLGKAKDQVCIEAAITLACGEPLSDKPTCVAAPDRAWAININDSPWPSPQARAEALWPLALAQLGTAGKDRTKWVQSVVLGTVQRVLPIVLRMEGFNQKALACEQAKDLEEAARAAYDAAGAASYATVDAARAIRAARDANAPDAAWTAASAVSHATKCAAKAGDAAKLKVLWAAVRVALDAYQAESGPPGLYGRHSR